MKTILLLCIALVFATSCDSDKTQTETTTTTESISSVTSDSNSAPSFMPSPEGMANPMPSGMSAPGQMPAPSGAPAPAAKVGKGLNPPHGQPGHRCDIPDGAPLSSAPAQQQPTMQTPQATSPSTMDFKVANKPANLSTGPAPANTPTAAGMNPPHGEPGHDCAIPVGSPLKN